MKPRPLAEIALLYPDAIALLYPNETRIFEEAPEAPANAGALVVKEEG